MDDVQEPDTFGPVPMKSEKDRGKWRTEKTSDGKTSRLKLFGRGETKNYSSEKEAHIDQYSAQKQSCMQNQFHGEMGAYPTALASILSGESTGVKEYEMMLSYINGIHQTILKGISLETFHDLNLSNPCTGRFLMETGSDVKDAVGKTVPLIDLKVFDGSSFSGRVNIVSEKSRDLPSIAGLEVIPVTDKIYVSLRSRGGFYYREGEILNLFDRMAEQRFMEEVWVLKAQSYVDSAKSSISAFNQKILTQDASGASAPADISETRAINMVSFMGQPQYLRVSSYCDTPVSDFR